MEILQQAQPANAITPPFLICIRPVVLFQIADVLNLERMDLYSETPSFILRLTTRDGKRRQYEFAGGLQREAFLTGVKGVW